jgi:hypothetical protein
VIFVLFGRYLPVVSSLALMSNRIYFLYKTLVFIGVLLPPFYYFGRILTVAYQIGRRDIGAIYSADFWGAALACAITPVVFHFGGLPNVSLLLLAMTSAPILFFLKGTLTRRVLIGVLLLAGCVVGQRIIATVDNSLDYSRYDPSFEIEELDHGWNEHSRVALLGRRYKSTGHDSYQIVHDNSRSNVHVWRYDERRIGRQPRRLESLEVAAILRRPTRNALVMFAGCGAEMIVLNELLNGKTRITGVELNELVTELAVEAPELEAHRLKEFYDLAHVDLVIDEGRHFLSQNEEKYDLIFVGSNAATGVWLTGHSRKYLDTVEAFDLYLDRLSEHGLLVFNHQPVERRLATMRRVFEERGITDFSQHVVILSSISGADDMVISPSGFTDAELRRLKNAAGRDSNRVLFAPTRTRNNKFYSEIVSGPVVHGQAMTDDRPFLVGLNWRDYTLVPDADAVKRMASRPQLYVNWIKISTLLIMILISTIFIAVAAFRRSAGLPPSVLVYLLMTGFCFMLVEIAVIAKLELFLQKPIVSMATVLSIFLLSSGIGSRVFPRVQNRIKISVLCLALAAMLAASVYAMNMLGATLLGIPLPLKLLVAFVLMAPIGVSLGLFYPYAVACLTANGRPQAVAITYGISTLSSVIGATYAMTIMLDVGFSSLLWQASVGYVVIALFFVFYTTVLRGRYLTL